MAWNLESCSDNVTDRKIVIPKDDINYDDQESHFEHDEYTNDAANVRKFNRHLIMNSGILEKALQKMMVLALAAHGKVDSGKLKKEFLIL